jgi:hypothetical protein
MAQTKQHATPTSPRQIDVPLLPQCHTCWANTTIAMALFLGHNAGVFTTHCPQLQMIDNPTDAKPQQQKLLQSRATAGSMQGQHKTTTPELEPKQPSCNSADGVTGTLVVWVPEAECCMLQTLHLSCLIKPQTLVNAAAGGMMAVTKCISGSDTRLRLLWYKCQVEQLTENLFSAARVHSPRGRPNGWQGKVP